MDDEGFGNCTNHGECEAACPKGISVDFIARMNRDYLKASLMGAEESRAAAGPGSPPACSPRRHERPYVPFRRQPPPDAPAASLSIAVDGEDARSRGPARSAADGQELERAVRLAQREVDGRRLVG